MNYLHRMTLTDGSMTHICGGDCRLPERATTVRLEGPFSEEEALRRFHGGGQPVTFAILERAAAMIARGEASSPSRLVPIEPPDLCGEQLLDSF